MNEIFFILKSLVITILLIMAMQIKVGNRTIEASCFHWLHESKVAAYIQDVADGGALLLQNTIKQVGDHIRNMGYDSTANESSDVRARR